LIGLSLKSLLAEIIINISLVHLEGKVALNLSFFRWSWQRTKTAQSAGNLTWQRIRTDHILLKTK